MTKKLFEIYVTYGKGSGEELYESWVAEDTPEEREEAFGKTYADDWIESPDDFRAGNEDSISFSTYGDWDDPTGGTLTVKDYDTKLNEISRNYAEELRRLDKQFKEDV